MAIFGTLKRAPAVVEGGEKPIRVDVVRVQPTDVSVELSGYGSVRPLRTVGVAAQVSGMVTEVHPSLRVGEIIAEGDVLFAIDDRDYRAAVAEASALAEQSVQAIRRLEEELRRSRERLGTGARNLELAEREFERVQGLFEEHQIGNQAEIDGAEQALNSARDAVDELEKHLVVAPMLIKEAESARAAAEARLERARRQVERCTVRAPFRARVVRSLIEEGQMAHVAADVVMLADDSVLEIGVPLDAREAHRWLRFRVGAGKDSAWFPDVEPVECRVRWTEAPEAHQWVGTLHRIEQLNPETRMLNVVVRVEGEQARNERGFPMVQGMFCAVEIPGRVLSGVHPVPRWALSMDRTVYVAENDRLATRPVRVVHTHRDTAYIDQGLADGDLLIVTRLNQPLEQILLDVNEIDAESVFP